MSDTIYRQMASDDLGEEPEVWEDDDEYGMGQRSEWCHIKKIIEKLPSAQPVNYGSTKSDSSSQLKLNNDLISRQDVLKILSSKNAAWDSYDKVKRLPSAQPSDDDVKEYCRKRCLTIVTNDLFHKLTFTNNTGKWLGKYCPYTCNRCGKTSDSRTPFCRYCGADMRE